MNRCEVQERLEAALDRLASVEHERWAHWQQYMHSKAKRQTDGSLVIPADLAAQWSRQIKTPYDKLTPEEQKSDQEQVLRYLPTIVDVLTTP